MSRLEGLPATVPTAQSLKRKQFSQGDQDDLDELDRIFKRVKTVVPRTPYILSTPSMNPYRYHSQQEANAWMVGNLWRYDEENVQYRTYLYREPCQDCFELQAGEDDEPEPEQPKSQPSSTANSTAKKKISLSAFKAKQANGTITPTPGSKKASPNLPPAKPPPTQANGVKGPEKPSTTTRKPEESRSQKRLPTESRDEQKPISSSQDSQRSETRPRPPPSSSQKSESVEAKINIDRSEPSNATPHGLPTLLSPVHQPLNIPFGLPNILSPTLPASIQAELDRLETQRSRAVSDVSTSSSDRKGQTLQIPTARYEKANEASKSGSRARSVSLNGKSPSGQPSKAAEELDSSLVVKLKFSKTKAPTVKQILRLPPKRTGVTEKKERQETPKATPTKMHASPPKVQMRTVDGVAHRIKPVPKVAARRPDTSSSTPSVKPASVAPKVLEKRPRTDDDTSLAVPSKRPRAHSTQDRPITPTQQPTSSPALSNKSSTQKPLTQFTTPKRDPKAVSMLRTTSADSLEATPGRSGNTPTSSRLDVKASSTSAPLNGKKQADISLLAQNSMKLNHMGRKLKHEAPKILTEKGNKATVEDEKRVAVTNLECILSYMAAYYAQDLSLNLRGRPGEVEQTWKTLLPLCFSYAHCTKDFKHLDGLRSYLSSVIAAAICTHVSQRALSARPHDSPHDVAHAELAKQHTSLAENFALLSDHTIKMNRHYQDARIALPMENVQSLYKKTWAGQESNFKLVKEPEKVSGVRLSGPYFLPLSMDTTPIQAVRFGLKFLAEYCEKEKLAYSLRVNLDRPE
ncbi:hypothetical protein P153DRAFT_376258 [Dothidotthia symphoricarpi CBS 119687]|uniref:Uncharacterized protein n=1 Tax=Dothidotthia symphoricarpi CBS 119687 TaxID=1392245 RepID=A0A6A6ACQ5_9PLEO|nr:uncharacterized protein P153DRAFT_376258 [Dothidotthia symphoricarpi CBS 119687]KAF2128905.1 hypothetical protein P153DRAFT_376258 [Dothidotthia symphoricarpi CBS 119687]